MRALLHILLVSVALALGCLCDTASAGAAAASGPTSPASCRVDAQRLDDASLWEREASGANVAQAQGFTLFTVGQAPRGAQGGGGKPSRPWAQHPSAPRRPAMPRTHVPDGAWLRAPHQFVAASRYYVFALRRIIC